jgi:predicted transposase YdaD
MAVKKQNRKRKKEQSHDVVFKAFFSDALIAKNYLLYYTPASVHEWIDFSVFEKSNTAFVSGRFGISFSDVVYETRLKGGGFARLLFLFEHKSYIPNQPVYLQLLDYLLQIWEDDLKNKRVLSFVLPIVVYHGEQTWQQKPFTSYFKGLPEDWNVFIPHFQYLLTDLSNTPTQVIQDKVDSEYLRSLFLVLKFAREQDLVFENWKKIFTFGDAHHGDRDKILSQVLMFYIINLFDMPEEQVNELNEKITNPEYAWMDAIPEFFGEKWKKQGLKEGRKLGKKEGREEGRQEGRLTFAEETVQRAILKFPNFSDTDIAELIGMDIPFVQSIRSKITKDTVG